MLKSTLQQTDPEIYNIIQKEAERQEYQGCDGSHGFCSHEQVQ